MEHSTTNVSDQIYGKDWNVTIHVDDTTHKNVTTVNRATKTKAIQAAWIHAKNNHEKYGIDEWVGGRLAIEVCRST